jgi:hypothetical protein
MNPDALQWLLVCELVGAHPETITIADLHDLHPDADVEEAVARLLIDGLAIRFGDWVKASEPAVRFEQLARSGDATRVQAVGAHAD